MHAGLIIYLIFLHFVSDFLFQSRAMANNKSSNLGYLLVHGIIIYATYLVGLYAIGYEYETVTWFCLANSAIHMVIDGCIWNLYKAFVYYRFPKAKAETYEYWNDKHFYTTIGLDQMLHITTALLLGGLL